MASSTFPYLICSEQEAMEIINELEAPYESAARLGFMHGWHAVLLVALISIVAVGVVFVLHTIGDIPVGNLTRDTAIVTGGHPWHGLLSQVGMFFWAGAGTMCLLLWTSATKLGADQRIAYFGLFSALLTVWLALDDTLMLHDIVLPARLGIQEKPLFVAYIVLFLAYLFFFRREIIRSDTKLLVLALALFATSVSVDIRLIPFNDEDLLYLLEDGAKFGGIVAWCGYFFVNTRSLVLRERQT